MSVAVRPVTLADAALAKGDVDAIEAELGDVFFALVNLCTAPRGEA